MNKIWRKKTLLPYAYPTFIFRIKMSSGGGGAKARNSGKREENTVEQ